MGIASWRLLKSKYKKLADEEIESVKQVFSNVYNTEDSVPEQIIKGDLEAYKTSENSAVYNSIVSREKYNPNVVEKPFIISPQEFGELDNYETSTLTYYDDKVLADSGDDVIEDIDEIVGEGSLTRFGEYEEDAVFVRNDILKCDYEILRSTVKYSDLCGSDVD